MLFFFLMQSCFKRILADTVLPLACFPMDRLQATDEMTYPSGISLMSAKNDTLLSYLQQLAVLMLARMEGEELPTEAVKGLVRDRVIVEKMRPLESKLRYQVEKLLRKAESAASHANEDGTQEDLGRSQLFAYFCSFLLICFCRSTLFPTQSRGLGVCT